MKLFLCIAFVNLNTRKCTWVGPVSQVNSVLSHYCTCLKGYLAIVVLGRTGAAAVLTHFRTYFRCQEKTTTCLCQRSSIVFLSAEERVISCVCAKRGHSLLVVKRDKRSMERGCVGSPSYFHTCFGGRQGTVLSGQRTAFYITFVT